VKPTTEALEAAADSVLGEQVTSQVALSNDERLTIDSASQFKSFHQPAPGNVSSKSNRYEAVDAEEEVESD
jgi:hypothetical protein